MLHHHQELCFECTGCGLCCLGDEDSYIATSKAELEKIRSHTGLGKAAFRHRHVVHYDDGSYGIRINSDGRCSFLNQDNKCSIYKYRPVQCKTYPFWPEILKNKHSWRTEARRCEGINRGEAVPADRIEVKLTQYLKSEPTIE